MNEDTLLEIEAVPAARTLAVFMDMLPAEIWQGLGIDPATALVVGAVAEATGTATIKRAAGEPVAVPTKVELGTSSVWHRNESRTYMVAFVSVGMHRRQLPALTAARWDFNEPVLCDLFYRAMTETEMYPVSTGVMNALVQMERTDLPAPDGTGAYDCTFCSPDGQSFSSHCPYCGGMARSSVPTPPYDADLWSLYVEDLPEDAEPPMQFTSEEAAFVREMTAAARAFDARNPKNSALYLGAVVEELARDEDWTELTFTGSTAEVRSAMRRPAVPADTDRRRGTWIGCDCGGEADCTVCGGDGIYVPGSPFLKGEMGWLD